MIVDIGVAWVMLNRLLECSKRLGRLALLHMYTSNLDIVLRERWEGLDRLLKIITCAR